MKYLILICSILLFGCNNSKEQCQCSPMNYLVLAKKEQQITKEYIERAKVYKANNDSINQWIMVDSGKLHLSLSDEYVEKFEQSR